MLYKVEWMLISWMGYSEYLAELSPEEKQELEAYFEAEHKAVRLMNYRITEVDIKSVSNLIEMHKDDLRNESELYKETEKKSHE